MDTPSLPFAPLRPMTRRVLCLAHTLTLPLPPTQVSLAHNDLSLLQRLLATRGGGGGGRNSQGSNGGGGGSSTGGSSIGSSNINNNNNAGGVIIPLGPRQLHDVVAVAAAAGVDTDLLTGLLDLAPPSQLSSRAFFAVISTSINRRHYKEAQQCLQRLQDMGISLSPALQQRQRQVRARLRGGGGGGGAAPAVR